MKPKIDQLNSYEDAPWAKAPKAYQNIVHEDENVIVFKDGYPVTEGHLLFVPKKKLRRADITICFEYARCTNCPENLSDFSAILSVIGT